MVLLLACICATLLGAERKEAKTELKFEIDNKRLQSWAHPRSKKLCQGPIKPSHVAEVLIMGDNKEICYFYTYVVGSEGIKFVSKAWFFPGTEGGKMILQTSAGRSMTQKQREFVEKSDFFLYVGHSNKVRNYSRYFLYAVSEMDAKKMVEAFCEILTEKADERMQEDKKLLSRTKEKISDIKKKLPEKQKQSKAAESKYKEIKNARYFSLDGGQAYKKAMETMLQMVKMLDTLEIELAGIREKMKTIERFRSGQERVRNQTNQVNYRLDEMFVEQMVELRGVEARKKATLRICNREKEFLDFYNQRANLEREVDGLERSLSKSEKDLSGLEGMLANPEPNMLPPKVYQNKVTIYPVKVED